MKSKVLIIFFTLLATSLHAQTGKLFDADKQLSSSFTSQVYLDRDGFIWVATRNGLNIYDGYKFHIIKKEEREKNGIASNYVNCLLQDHNGLFYIGMYGALQTFDGDKFYNVEVKDLDGNVVPCYMTCFLQRKNGEILAGTSGHGVIKFSDRTHAKQLNGALRKVHTATEMIEDRKGHVWIVTGDKGLLEYDGKNAKAYLDDETFCSALKRVCEDKDGNIYVGTSNNGVFVRDASGKNGFRHLEVTGNRHVSALYCNREGQILMGFDGQGMGIYDTKNGTMQFNPYFSKEIDLAKSKVYSIVEDAGGNVWLGLLQKGLFMQPGKVSNFRYMGYKLGERNLIGSACVVSTLVDKKGRAWVGTDKDGLYCLADGTHLLKHFFDNFPSTVLSMVEDSKGRIWIGSYSEGFGYIDTGSMTYHHHPQYQGSSFFSIGTSDDNTLWLATMGQGLLRMDLGDGSIRAYTMKQGAGTDRKVNSIANDYISKMSVSPDKKKVYVATTMGVCCLDIEKDTWTNTFGGNCLNYGIPSRVVKEFNGIVWVGTNDGLYKFDPKTRKLEHYSSEKGLADNGIASIECDKTGRLWISTDHGLCCLDPKTGLVQSFFVDNGLQSNEFSDGASFSTPEGVMLFGGVGGVSWFKPESIQQVKWNAKVKLTGFSINGEPVTSTTLSDGDHVCDTTVIASDRFELAYHDNSFAIQLSTLTYVNPENITYLYSINNEDYVRLQPGVNEITFSHLSPGTYHFKVKAERSSQTTPEREFTVVVKAPWYRSFWAYLVYLSLAAFALWEYLKFRKKKELDRLELQEHIHAEEMGEAKLRFFMNISHEIRTPMTLIITPLLSLMKSDDDPNRKGVYEIIKRNAERILHLVNQMMDIRKIDKGMMQMRMQETDLIGFVNEIHTMFGHQAKTKQIEFNFEHDDDKLPVWIDRQNFDKVIVNILSNAFKFTPVGGKINIRVSQDGQNATIAISDNGEKIPEDKLDKIFERFYQTASPINNRNSGTGIGLDLTRSLVELHYGVIKARNLDEGCEFSVTIPMGKDHLKPEEILIKKENEESSNVSLELLEMPMPEITTNVKAKEKVTIVVAEDDDEIREYLVAELGKDYEVKACRDGREALAEVYRTMPDLVVSDVMMPEMDGNTLCSQLKLNKVTNDIPVILLTAKSRDEDRLEGLETGADAYIVKPFNMDILRRNIINLINSHKLLRMKYGQTEKLEEKMDEVKMKSPDEKLLERVMNTINKHINNSDLSVDMIAEEVGISRVHLHRKMKELTGQTPHDFIRGIRLKRAANLLASKNMNITEVVYACGFSNAASFSTIFKSVYGMSPRDYMKEHRNK